MAARTRVARATLDKHTVLLAWAPPLLALSLCAGICVTKHAGRAEAQAGRTATEASTLAGAGSAILSHATFY